MSNKRHVDIVDDEASVRELLALLLSTAQIESRDIRLGGRLSRNAPQDEPACVILDNQLPGLSGIGLLKRIAAADGRHRGHPDHRTCRRSDRGLGDEMRRIPFCSRSHSTPKRCWSRSRTRWRGPSRPATASPRSRSSGREAPSSPSASRKSSRCWSEGLPTKMIARQLGITPRTTEHHRAAVMHKMQRPQHFSSRADGAEFRFAWQRVVGIFRHFRGPRRAINI